ncbi:MAG: CPBP family intramembrane metalloprotease [Lachnospiraceae bacterium]|nr:CPBP family intramembrane metalloprotease [Lachnospiraceae bacterium]
MNKKTDTKSRILTILFSLGVIIAMLLIQSGVEAIGIIPKSISILSESGGDTAEYTRRYTEFISTSPILTYLLFAADLVCILVAAIWYYLGYVKKDKAAGTYKPITQKFEGFKSAAFVFCGCLASWGLAAILQQIISLLMPETANAFNSSLGNILGGNAVLGIITAVILAPIAEELTVRGIILQRSKRSFGVIGCMIISAVMFGIFHMNPIQAVYVLPMGLFWGFVGYRFNSVIPCIFCHILNNFIGVAVPVVISPIIIFIVFAALTAFMGVKFNYFSFEKETETIIEESKDVNEN